MNHTEKQYLFGEIFFKCIRSSRILRNWRKRLRQIAGENEGADFILEVGSHIRFKRKLFEDYLDTASTV